MRYSAKVKDLCSQLEHLAEDRKQIYETCRVLDHMDSRLCSQQETIEQELMDLLNTGESGVFDIGRLRMVFQPVDNYTTRPWFEVRYPDYCGVYTKRHYLRKPGQKARKKK